MPTLPPPTGRRNPQPSRAIRDAGKSSRGAGGIERFRRGHPGRFDADSTAGDIADGSRTGVFGQRFATDGSKAGAEFLVNGHTKSDQNNPGVAAMPDGRFVVAWTSNAGGTCPADPYAQQFNAEGVRVFGQ